MAAGRHWEWRGFGKVSDAFRKTFSALSVIEEYARQDARQREGIVIEDEYLVIPGSTINVKLRSGLGEKDGLKLKYFERQDGELELWNEPEGSTLSLKDLTQNSFTHVLGPKLHMMFPSVPSGPIDAQKVRSLFSAATPAAVPVLVKKHRRTRRWNNLGETVLVEIAQISVPETIVSVSLESEEDLTSATQNETEEARVSILAALISLKLGQEELEVMNYLKALQIWAKKESIIQAG